WPRLFAAGLAFEVARSSRCRGLASRRDPSCTSGCGVGVKRGQVWFVDLGDPVGSQSGLRRPVLIVQDDLPTDSRLGAVMVAPMTSNLQRALAVGNVEVSARQSNLPRASVVLVCQVMTVDKSLFGKQQGSLSSRVMAKVDRGLALALGLQGAGL